MSTGFFSLSSLEAASLTLSQEMVPDAGAELGFAFFVAPGRISKIAAAMEMDNK
jgi:hypothetical protein